MPVTSLALGALASLAAVGGSSTTTPAHTNTFAPTTEPEAACADYEFRCDNGKCIPDTDQCNAVDECGDGSDENCTQTDCNDLGDTFLCDGSRCIYAGWQCDGEEDCVDGTDDNCTVAECINHGRDFFCDDEKKCVSDALQCDGNAHCDDGSDENCTLADCGRLNRTFFCDDSRCISAGWLCDGHDDCEDGSDERVALCNPVSSGLSGTSIMAMPTSAAPQATVSNPAMNVSGLSRTSIMALPTSAAPQATVSKNPAMNVSGLPGTTMALPTSAAPLAATLNSGAIAGIALGAAALVLTGVAGVYIYRHYHRRSSPADADDLQELVTINNTAVQEAVDQPMIEGFREEARGEPAGEQRSGRPPEPPGLKKTVLPEKPPIRAREPFYEELREQVIPWHEHINEDVAEYEDVDTCNPRRMSTAL